MPENPSQLHVVGRTSDGGVWHTVRSPTGWTPFDNVLTGAGLVSLATDAVDVSCLRIGGPGLAWPEGLYVMVAFGSSPPRLLRRPPGGPNVWQQMPLPPFPNSRRTAIAGALVIEPILRFDLHSSTVTDDGHLLVATQDSPAGSPTMPHDIEWFAGDRGDLRTVALRSTSAINSPGPLNIELLAASAEGRIFRSEGRDTTWSFLTDFDSNAGPGQRPGDVLDVAVAVDGQYFYYVIVTGNGQAWVAIQRYATGVWQRWRDLEIHTAVIVGGDWNGTTISEVFDVGTFNSVAVGTTTEGYHVLVTTTDGRLWHQLRNDPTAIFRDVEQVGVGQNVGTFTAVACA